MKQVRKNYWLTISGLAIVAAAFLGNHAVPLYDGVGFPDEPYRFVSSSNPSNTEPTPVSATVSKNVLTHGYSIYSNETGPQVKVVFSPDGTVLPAAASQVRISIVPQAPADQPSSGKIAGNVYLIDGKSNAGPIKFVSGFTSVYLRVPQRTTFSPQPYIIFRKPGGTWQTLATNRTGNDIYQANFENWGEYAMSAEPAGGSGSIVVNSRQSSTLQHLLISLVLTVGIVGGLLIVIRLLGKRNHAGANKK